MTEVRWVLLACAVALALGGCGRSHGSDGGSGGQTNWLRECSADADCDGDADSCLCGVCTTACDGDESCGEALRCQQAGSTLHDVACWTADEPPAGLCAPECERDADCYGTQWCISGVCEPMSVAASDAATSPSAQMPSGGDGAQELWVDANLAVDAACDPDAESVLQANGVLDIDPGAASADGACRGHYFMHLRTHNSSGERVVVNSAQVSIRLSSGQTIVFDRFEPALPNPTTVPVAAPVTLEPEDAPSPVRTPAIHADYRAQMDGLADRTVVVAVALRGETESGRTVTSNAFEFPVEVCEGCLTLCDSELQAMGVTVDDLAVEGCVDNAGADGRVCIDSDC